MFVAAVVVVVRQLFLTLFLTSVAVVMPMSMSMSSSSASSPPGSISSCAVVGVGVLGTSLCKQLLSEFPDITVTGITKTTNNHESIREQIGQDGKNVDRLRLVTESEINPEEKFRNVVFCAPPSGFDDYAGAVGQAVNNLWAGVEGGGVFAFTSSGGVYGSGDDGGTPTVDESTPTADPENNPRVARLLNGEKACLEKGGCCLRLAGLYSLERGAHNYWLTCGKDIMGAPEGIINLLHYDDAAGACLATIKAGLPTCRGRVFLVSDGHPMTRRAIIETTLKSKAYEDMSAPKFAGGDCYALGKIYDGSVTNKALNWSPKYPSFEEFMTAH